ncbi:MAG: hypothetical protein LUI85_04395 [Bacteroides sp.]|nr:hypothetical protein [Bacteroides sp.]
MDVARICEAHSNDGVNWIRSLENPILSPTYNSWDSDAVYKPAVVYNDDSIFVWYNGRYGRKEYIGFAFNNNKYF